ncbi:phosphatase PAP2 family protein [Chromatiaceae bacterium AAb-1]|nr:phosphatase PAP2 family protein [Chromatiaceae bacterium AAb-1]
MKPEFLSRIFVFCRNPIIISVLLSGIPANAVAGSQETAADILRIAIPAVAWSATQLLDDSEGEKQFYYSFASNIIATYALKQGISKSRPNHEDNDAFPSGHASMAFQGAAFLQQRYGWKYGLPAYALATYVGYSRVNTDHHDTWDVLAGAAIGIASSYYFTTPYQGFRISPFADGRSVGITLSKQW